MLLFQFKNGCIDLRVLIKDKIATEIRKPIFLNKYFSYLEENPQMVYQHIKLLGGIIFLSLQIILLLLSK